MFNWGSLVEPFASLASEFIEDKDKANELAFKLNTMAAKHAQELAKGQIEINKTEAAHRSIFVAGWRPFIGWTCGAALAWHFIISPFVVFIAVLVGYDLPELPAFDMGSLMTVLMGMLGLGTMRSFEKHKGVSK
jgi:hypothetical protein